MLDERFKGGSAAIARLFRSVARRPSPSSVADRASARRAARAAFAFASSCASASFRALDEAAALARPAPTDVPCAATPLVMSLFVTSLVFFSFPRNALFGAAMRTASASF